jgi:hypothetical protein
MVIRSKAEGAKELVLTDACNHRLGRFTMDGALIGGAAEDGTGGDLDQGSTQRCAGDTQRFAEGDGG